MRLIKSALIFFTFVFATGFFLGAIRVQLVTPWAGNRTAQLLEMPLMMVVIVVAARLTNRRLAPESGSSTRLTVGLLAATMMLASEIAVGMALRGESPVEALVNRDPVAGTAYYLALGAFALMPWLLGRERTDCATSPIDRIIPIYDVRVRHEILVRAPSAFVVDVARNFDLRTVPTVQALFWLRAKLLV
jgi:hypothetical protein